MLYEGDFKNKVDRETRIFSTYLERHYKELPENTTRFYQKSAWIPDIQLEFS